jgi:hypothetical protein
MHFVGLSFINPINKFKLSLTVTVSQTFSISAPFLLLMMCLSKLNRQPEGSPKIWHPSIKPHTVTSQQFTTSVLSVVVATRCALHKMVTSSKVQCIWKIAVHVCYSTQIWLSVSKLPLQCAVVSLYSVVKQWLKCSTGKVCNSLTLSLLMPYIYIYIYMEFHVKREILTSYIYIYMDLRLATLKVACFYFTHNVSTLNQCRKFSCHSCV